MVRERANERACDLAIRKTLAYRAVFRYPLSYHQLYSTLITNKKFKHDFFDKELSKLVKKGYIGYRDGKYFDKRIKPVSWDTRNKSAIADIKKASQVAKILKKIPWIKLLCVTGSVAAFNADKDADIDIFIVTKKHRLWLTRGFVATILKTLGIYQKGSGPGKVCPNLLIDDETLEWPEKFRSIFTAHEIVLMHPLINRSNTYFDFLSANTWIKNYLGNFNFEHEKKPTGDQLGTSRIVNVLEKLAQYLQLKYMKPKRTNEIIEKHMLHFRKNDNTSWIIESYKKYAPK